MSRRAVVVVFVACALAVLAAPGVATASAGVGEFEALAPSKADLTSLAVDTSTNVVYGQQNEGKAFYSYDPRTNVWTELAEAPVESGNNGGATYLNGKIYTAYTENPSVLGVYDIESNSWTTIPNPLGLGTGDIAADGEELYLADESKFVKYNPATETTTNLAAPVKGFESWGGLQPYDGDIYGDVGNGETGFEVYDVAKNEWTELPSLPGGAVLGSALDPVSGTYFAYGSYGGTTFYSYNIASKEWSTATLPFSAIGDGGLVYVPLAGHVGIYAIQGEDGTDFTRYVTNPPHADLGISLSASSALVTTGGEIAYAGEVTNAGPSEATGVTVTDTLPANVTLVSATASQGSCSGTTTVTCSLGALAPAAAAKVAIKVTAKAAGTAANTVAVAAEQEDPNAANNSASVSTTVLAPVVVKPQEAPPRCVVPKMRGLTLSQVKAALAAAGCKLGSVAHHYSRITKGGLMEQNRHQGTILPVASKVSIWLSLGHRSKPRR
ncbi:MAG TPA: PASTA domain-containing protein [Solirubrobacteraceae bacterium]|nr:PASTA domain-containing protein [Solirubrobacteraceae bacterium]